MKKLLSLSFIVCLFAVTSNAQVPSYVPTTGLAAWYSFTGNVNDLTGNGNTPTNTAVTYVPDRNGNASSAGSFNGTSSVLTLNTPSFTFSETGAFTYSVWLKKSTQTSAGVVMMSGSAAAGNFISIIQGQTAFQFGTNKQQSTWVWATCPHTLNQWDHYAVVYNAGAMYIYKNGAYASGATYTNFGAASVNLPFYIGRGLPGGANNYVGAMDDIGIWTRALSGSEILALYNSVPLGVSSIEDENTFSLYPNPASDVVNVKSPLTLQSAIYFIYDQSGKQMAKGVINKENTMIDIHQLAKGNYFIQVGKSVAQPFTVLKD